MEHFVKVYIADTEGAVFESLLEKYASLIEPKRLSRIESTKNEREKLKLLCTGVLLYKALHEHGISSKDILYKENGKPYIGNRNDFFFNLSHSGDKIFLCLSDAEIGCDIQKEVEANDSLIKRICSEEEIIENPDVSDEFNLVWAIKESFTKLSGIGISYDFKNITYERDKDLFKIFDRNVKLAYAIEIDAGVGYRAVVTCCRKIHITEIKKPALI